MDNISKILFDRLVKKQKKFQFYKEKYKLDRSQFDNKLKSITNCKEIYADELIVRAYKLFESKVNNEKKFINGIMKIQIKSKSNMCFRTIVKSMIRDSV